MACKHCHADDCDHGSKCGADVKMILDVAQVVGADVSDTMLKEMQVRAPRLSMLAHALSLAFAAKVADANLRAVLATEPPEKLARYVELRGMIAERAETVVALAHLADAQKGPVGSG